MGEAREPDLNHSRVARQAIDTEVRATKARIDREAYLRQPEHVDPAWADAEAWGR